MNPSQNPTNGLRWSRRWLLEQLQRVAPARWVRVPEVADPERAALVCVYRKRNVAHVRAAIKSLPPGFTVRLWALDEPVEDLSELTVGVGPGGRTALLNALVADLPFEPEMLVVMDDDAVFVVGGIERLLDAGTSLGFDIFQPAHSRTSQTAFGFVRKRPLLFARETTFVEQGPIVVLSRRAQRLVLPLPEELVMGWGVEVRWHGLAVAGELRLGIVDAVAVRHVGSDSSPRHGYDTGPELDRLRRELAVIGHTDMTEIQSTVRTVGLFGPWRCAPRPRWTLHRRGVL